ncbi:hypothetical protein DU67_19690 [Methanosarcina mazei]|uniref:Uncharacterized protein n=1 Tax=Methanosarcina mazei TaxID=2209 RepID=A0A0F8HJY0_METMZ|nr:hypothetical protein DU67_19690 [Methanosarcina mazei]
MNVTLSTGPLTTAWNPTLLAFPETVKLVIVVLQVAALATGIALTTGKNQTAGGHPTLKDGVCFGPPARLLGDR